MAIGIAFRKKALSGLTNELGVYILCDLDKTPIYVGQSSDGIRNRVNRHLTSARSDIIANRQIDVWEIAWVMAFVERDDAKRNELEARLYNEFNDKSPLMNGATMPRIATTAPMPDADQIVQVMEDEEIAEKRQASLRLPRQAEHYSQIVGHFLAVKNSPQIARAIDAHFSRLAKYHKILLGFSDPQSNEAEND